METFRRKIQQDTGWSDAIVNAIQSEAEARIYMNAGLEETMVNGRPALVQPRIDPDYLMPEWWIKEHGENWRGWSNSDLMGEGYPPHDKNGDPYELHHIGQLTDSPLAELTWAQHHEQGNYSVLHTVDDYSDIDRQAFEKEKAAHWSDRYKQVAKRKWARHTLSPKHSGTTACVFGGLANMRQEPACRCWKNL